MQKKEKNRHNNSNSNLNQKRRKKNLTFGLFLGQVRQHALRLQPALEIIFTFNSSQHIFHSFDLTNKRTPIHNRNHRAEARILSMNRPENFNYASHDNV